MAWVTMNGYSMGEHLGELEQGQEALGKLERTANKPFWVLWPVRSLNAMMIKPSHLEAAGSHAQFAKCHTDFL
jgi:hypothetical protein